MSLVEARKEVSRITQALLAIKPEEEALEIARSIPDGDWFELIDDVPPIELIAREVQLLTAFQKRDELVTELVEALELVLGVISDERGWGTVSRMEGSWIYTEASQAKAVAIPILAKAKAIDAEEKR